MNSTFHTFLLALPFLVHLASCTSGGQKTYYPDGTLKSVQTPNFHETYHENGKVKERISVNSAGQRNGDTIEYLSDGRAWSSRPYRNGEEDGTEYRLYPTRTPVCSWRDGIVRSVYQDGGWQTRELTPAEQASIERKEDAERLRMEMAMRQSEREAQSRQNTLSALQGLAAGLQTLNNSTSSYSGSGGSGLASPGRNSATAPQYSSAPARQANPVSEPSSSSSSSSSSGGGSGSKSPRIMLVASGSETASATDSRGRVHERTVSWSGKPRAGEYSRSEARAEAQRRATADARASSNDHAAAEQRRREDEAAARERDARDAAARQKLLNGPKGGSIAR